MRYSVAAVVCIALLIGVYYGATVPSCSDLRFTAYTDLIVRMRDRFESCKSNIDCEQKANNQTGLDMQLTKQYLIDKGCGRHE